MNNLIIIKLRAFDLKAENGVSSQFDRHYGISNAKELSAAIKQFDEECPFRKYDMETEAEHNDQTPLTEQEREWFLAEDKKSNIGFL